MSLMERFADPELIHDMTIGQQMAGSGITAIMGMGVTFAVLFFLWGCIAAMARAMKCSSALPVQQEVPAATPPAAVIAAAVSAYEGTGSGFVVRKIYRSPQQGWAYAERFERKVSR